MADKVAAELWSFALRFYNPPEVQRICLTLQDECGADVPLVIFLIFAASQGRVFDPAELRLIDSRVAPWRRDVVHNLRHVRRVLRTVPDGEAQRLRQSVKAAELEAERQEMTMLYSHLEGGMAETAPGVDAPACAKMNMLAYADLLPSITDELMSELMEQVSRFLAPPAQ